MAIAIDASTPALVSNSTTAKTTASFTAPAGAILVVCVALENTTTVTITNSGTALTWTSRIVRKGGDSGAQSGYAGIFTAVTTSAVARTVTATSAATNNAGGMKVFVVTGADTTNPVGAVGSGSSTTGTITPNAYTSTVAGSRGIGVGNDFSAGGSPTSTDTGFGFDVSGRTSGIALHKAVDTASPAAVTMNFTAASSPAAWNWAAVEIKPPTNISATVSAATVDAVAVIPAPSFQAGQTVRPATVTATAVIPAPGVTAGARVSPGTVTATAAIPNPSVTAGSAELVEPATVTATAVIPAPTVTAISNATPNLTTVTATGVIPAPTVTATRQAAISPATVDAIADIPTPGLAVPILPGDSLTRDGQVEWGYIPWGWNDFTVREITGWVDQKPPLDDLSVDDPARHGAIAGQSLAKRRIVTVKLQLNAGTDPTQISALLRQLRYDTRTLRDNTLWPLVVRTYTETLLAYGKVIDRTGVLDKDWSAGRTEPVITIMCPDSRVYSLEQQSTVILPDQMETLVNDGDVYTNPILRFPGPALNPVIMNETLDRVLGFNLTLAEGQRLDVDTQLGTVRVGTINHMRSLADAISVPVKEWFLDVGASDVTYETDSGGDAGVEVIWRSATM